MRDGFVHQIKIEEKDGTPELIRLKILDYFKSMGESFGILNGQMIRIGADADQPLFTATAKEILEHGVPVNHKAW